MTFAPDALFYDGFDKYGQAGMSAIANMELGEWTGSAPPYNVTGSHTVNAPLSSTGFSNHLASLNPNAQSGIAKTLSGSFVRSIGGIRLNSPLLDVCGVVFSDSGTNQSALTIETTGLLGWRRGSMVNALVATASASVTANTTHFIEWDVVINGTTGVIKVWLDGVLTTLNLTAQNTKTSANNSFNQFIIGLGSAANFSSNFIYDDLYLGLYNAAGGPDTPLLTSPAVCTTQPTADSSVAFTPGAGILGQDYVATANTNAPGANELFLRQFTPAANMTINSVSCIPNATSAGANFKAVIYTDSAGAPGTLLSSGTQVTGTTAGSLLTGVLTTPQALTAGTPYWIGFITDTSVVLDQVDTTTTGVKAANTYASGAPGTAPAMTINQPSWLLYGNCSAQAHNFPQVNFIPPVGIISYNTGSTVGQQDLFTMGSLPGTASIVYSSAIKVFANLSASGARTVNLQQKLGATTGNGSAPGVAPTTSFAWLSSYFNLDPTGAAWTVANQNAATAGYAIAT